MNLFYEVAEWAAHKGILGLSTPKEQFVKMAEELGEIAECLNKGNMDKLKGEIGDLMVTAIILAELSGHDAEGCLLEAYDKIYKRKGKMVDGVFVKEGDN